ncbi:hypothetical protein [Desulfonema magnum]|uniref:Uncharacterized protein n=1 Tax=Desulfonema magnum TaxID=45655 RepID=A0A975BFF5_9BACT|nr:hypothetical protein [Desulfonema magnum]QTA84070.1 Uncharacterized protein dnm_000620 [Desulfonema magnum]
MKKAIVLTIIVLFSLLNVGTLLAAEWSDGSDGAIYYNGGNVGIGLNTPEYRLSVLDKLFILGNHPELIIAGTDRKMEWRLYSRGPYFKIYAYDPINETGTPNNPAIIAVPSGEIGIGTGLAALTEKLEVNGTVKATAFFGQSHLF